MLKRIFTRRPSALASGASVSTGDSGNSGDGGGGGAGGGSNRSAPVTAAALHTAEPPLPPRDAVDADTARADNAALAALVHSSRHRPQSMKIEQRRHTAAAVPVSRIGHDRSQAGADRPAHDRGGDTVATSSPRSESGAGFRATSVGARSGIAPMMHEASSRCGPLCCDWVTCLPCCRLTKQRTIMRHPTPNGMHLYRAADRWGLSAAVDSAP